MQFKKILPIFLCSFTISACSTLVYRIDVPQGNFLEASQVAQIKVGMTKPQVQYLLGTPVLDDPFSSYRWHYVYLRQHGFEKPEQNTFIVDFNKEGVVTDFHLDKPLPKDPQATVNNTVIKVKATPPKSIFSWFW